MTPAPANRQDRTPAEKNPDLKEMDILAKVLDDLVTIPGTNIGIGLDGIIGLVPGIGDTLTTTVASVVMIDAVRHQVPINVLLRMALNLVVDTALGYVPFIGDAADFAHRANRKNYKLLAAAVAEGRQTEDSHQAYLVKAVGVTVGVLLLMVASAIFTIWLLVTFLVAVLG